jgi:hypothetical protein
MHQRIACVLLLGLLLMSCEEREVEYRFTLRAAPEGDRTVLKVDPPTTSTSTLFSTAGAGIDLGDQTITAMEFTRDDDGQPSVTMGLMEDSEGQPLFVIMAPEGREIEVVVRER